MLARAMPEIARLELAFFTNRFVLSERVKELAQFRSEQLRLLGSQEVAAARHFGPTHDVVDPLGPLGRAGDRVVLREEPYANRHIDLRRGAGSCWLLK